MPVKPLNLKRIAATNPAIDLRQIAEAARLIKDLQANGIGPAAYDLSTPFSRQMKAVDITNLPVAVISKRGD